MKKILTTIICMFLVLSITGCNNSKVFNNTKDVNSNTGVGDNNDDTINSTKGIEVYVGQNIQYDDNYNISFLEANIVKSVEPTNPGQLYTHYVASDGNLYVVLKTVIKNLGTDAIKGDNIPKGKLIYNDKYKYTNSLITEKDDGSDLQNYYNFMSINPLSSENIWYVFEVPEEVNTNTQANLIVQYQINGKTYNVKIR